MGAALSVAVASAPASARADVPTLEVSLPGTLSGCYFYSPATNDALRAVLDLVRPSPFTATYSDNLVGASGPIASAELVSLSPQTVVYTVSPHWTWTNGEPFSGEDLLSWYQAAVDQPTSLADGYRDIGSITLSANLSQVTVVFSTPYSGWETLFRDMNAPGEPTTCTLASLAGQPSLGPYELTHVDAEEAVLAPNPTWKGPQPTFSHVIVRAGTNPDRLGSVDVDYRNWETSIQAARVTGEGRYEGHVGSSDEIVTVGFSPLSPFTSQLAVRQFLGFSVDRQSLINQVVGPITYNQALADSVIFPEGASGYPGFPGIGPTAQSKVTPLTTVPPSLGQDCVACAAPILESAGFTQSRGRWVGPSGHSLALTLAVGPGEYDAASARIVAADWRAEGVEVRERQEGSEQAVAWALARGQADVGVMTVTTGLSPQTTVRSWTGQDFGDGFDTGWRSVQVNEWYASALDTFNPVDALSQYTSIDDYISAQAWQRPLFTAPSILTWSVQVAGVYGSLSLQGIVDQVPSWGYAPYGPASS